MKLRFLRERALAELKDAVEDNLERYRNGDFSYLAADPSLSFESQISFDERAIAKLKMPEGEDKYDARNCEIFLKAFQGLTPYEAADERLWSMLSHTVMLPHARVRWPIPKETKAAVNHIETHFFASSQRQLERDNVAGRLWWMGHLCARVQDLDLKNTLDVLLFRSDVRANIIERPSTAQSVPVFSALLCKLAKSYEGKQRLFERKTFRSLMVRLNGVGGYKLLDALDSKSVERFISEIIAKDLKLSEKEM